MKHAGATTFMYFANCFFFVKGPGSLGLVPPLLHARIHNYTCEEVEG